jgi:hypothetical protein
MLLSKMKIVYIIVLCSFLFCCKKNERSFNDVLVKKYNEEIEKAQQMNKEWVNSPVFIVYELMSSKLTAKETVLEAIRLNDGEVPREVKIVFKEKGQLDDSSDEVSYEIFFKKNNSVWLIDRIY